MLTCRNADINAQVHARHVCKDDFTIRVLKKRWLSIYADIAVNNAVMNFDRVAKNHTWNCALTRTSQSRTENTVPSINALDFVKINVGIAVVHNAATSSVIVRSATKNALDAFHVNTIATAFVENPVFSVWSVGTKPYRQRFEGRSMGKNFETPFMFNQNVDTFWKLRYWMTTSKLLKSSKWIES